VLIFAAIVISFLNGTIQIQTPTYSKKLPLLLAGEVALFACVASIFLYNCWIYVWGLPHKLKDLLQKIKKNDEDQRIINGAYAAIGGISRPFVFSNEDIASTDPKLAICQALIADKCADMETLKLVANMMILSPPLEALGHIYLAKVHEQANNWKEALRELLAAKSVADKALHSVIQARLFLAYLKNIPNVDYAEFVLSRKHVAILFAKTGTPELLTRAYDLDPTNIDAACHMAEKWSESVSIKKLISLIQSRPNLMVVNKIVSINSKLNKLEIYEKIKSALLQHANDPEALYILGKSAMAAGLRGEAIHYASELEAFWAPLISPRVRELKRTRTEGVRTEGISVCRGIEAGGPLATAAGTSAGSCVGIDVYECKNCHAHVASWESYCAQCGEVDSLAWRVVVC
jgi:hypothetical protein